MVKNIRPNNGYRRTVQLEETTHSVVTDCQGIIALTNCSNNFVYGNQAKNIALFNSNHNQVYENTLSEGYIIYPRASSEMSYGRRCIDLSASSYNDIFNNTLQDSNRGIHLGEPEGASQYNNIFLNNISNVGTGVLLSYSSQNYVYSNNIGNCSVGISVSVSNDVIATQNNITNCGLALSVIGSNNQFYHNNFVNNTNQVTVEDQRLFDSIIILAYSVNNTFDIGYPAGGNYWSNFQGVDSNGDGISETPYTINSNNTDNYPLMQPNNSSNFISPRQPSNETPDTIVPELQTWIILPLIVLISLAIACIKLRKRKLP
jgi:nitrous oxidase accessory protein NosD